MGITMGSLNAPAAEPASEEFKLEPSPILELTEECHHYEEKREVPWDLQKYFSQRYSIFSLYDYGVYMTDDAWFGVTPEPVAHRVAQDMSGVDAKKRIIVDLFAGAGGNTIAFGLSSRWDHVVSLERDASTLACAQNNALVYGVPEDKITWVHGDSFTFVDALTSHPEDLHPDLRLDLDRVVMFASPPWGGPGYRTDEVFDLHTMQPYGLDQLHGAYQRMDHALYLPRTSNLRQIAKIAPEGRKLKVTQYCMEGAAKAMVAYIPAKKNIPEEGTRKKRSHDSTSNAQEPLSKRRA